MRALSKDEIRVLEEMKSSLGKIPTAIYARKSKEDRSQEALNVQTEACKALIQNHAKYFNHIKTYQEDDVSGKDIEGRSEFKKLLDAVDEGFIKVVVISKWDRLSRSTKDLTYLRSVFPKMGALIITIEDSGNQDAVSTLMRDIMGAISQFYLHKISEDTKSVLIKKTSSGQSGGGRANYGYEYYKNDHGEIRLRQNPLEAPVVHEIFSRYAMGWSFQAIIDDLNKRNIKTRDGNQFSRSTLSDMLRNVKYYGVYRYNRQDRPQSPISHRHYDEVWVENGIEGAIVSEETFNYVQNRLKSDVGRKKNSKYLLTGVMTCDQCGAKMVGSSQSRGSGKERKLFYICPNNLKRNGAICTNKGISADLIEPYVKELVFESMKSYTQTSQFDVAKLKTRSKNEHLRLKGLQTTKRNLNRTQQQLMDRLVDDPTPMMTQSLERKLIEIQEEINTISHFIEETKSKINAIKAIEKDVSDGFLTKDILFSSLHLAKKLIHSVVNHIQFGPIIRIDFM